jgi:hypothetical protein
MKAEILGFDFLSKKGDRYIVWGHNFLFEEASGEIKIVEGEMFKKAGGV